MCKGCASGLCHTSSRGLHTSAAIYVGKRGSKGDFCFCGKGVREGVTLEEASKNWLDTLRLHSHVTQKVISEQTKCGRSFVYVRLYQTCAGVLCAAGEKG